MTPDDTVGDAALRAALRRAILGAHYVVQATQYEPLTDDEQERLALAGVRLRFASVRREMAERGELAWDFDREVWVVTDRAPRHPCGAG